MDNTEGMSSDDVGSKALGSSDPFDALYQINPELASVAYDDIGGLLSLEGAPERVALIQEFVNRYQSEQQ